MVVVARGAKVLHQALSSIDSLKKYGETRGGLLRGAAFQRTLLGAIAWLKKYPLEKHSNFVFNRILRRKDTSDADFLTAAKIASDWLSAESRSSTDKASVVNALLKRPVILPYGILQTSVDARLDLHVIGRQGPDVDVLQAIEHLPFEDPLAQKVRAALGIITN